MAVNHFKYENLIYLIYLQRLNLLLFYCDATDLCREVPPLDEATGHLIDCNKEQLVALTWFVCSNSIDPSFAIVFRHIV